MSTTYSVGYSMARKLLGRATVDREREAIERLAQFSGGEHDVLTAAQIFTRGGLDDMASDLLALLPAREGS